VEDGVPTFTPDPEGFHDMQKNMPDENGNFKFNDLPTGDYYLITFIIPDKNTNR